VCQAVLHILTAQFLNKTHFLEFHWTIYALNFNISRKDVHETVFAATGFFRYEFFVIFAFAFSRKSGPVRDSINSVIYVFVIVCELSMQIFAEFQKYQVSMLGSKLFSAIFANFQREI
jgi:hypothetical protein